MLVADLIRDQTPTSIGTGESVAMALRLMRERAIRHLPVVAPRQRVVGILSEREVLRQQVALGSTAAGARTVREAMVPSPIVVRDDEDIASSLASSPGPTCSAPSFREARSPASRRTPPE
jgi:CBS domain-containing protein